ncbi:hypothetical protein BT69DRAFT_1256392 [Atractiella rhizophila]|nr:hypothetical protein BT69DRAFT_1256392 [Atractiella rhizophila]
MSCNRIREDLGNCLLRSNCVLRDGNTPQDCIRNHMDELPEECKLLRQALYDCKRGMLDMRKRFRGNDPGQYKQDIEKQIQRNTIEQPSSAAPTG